MTQQNGVNPSIETIRAWHIMNSRGVTPLLTCVAGADAAAQPLSDLDYQGLWRLPVWEDGGNLETKNLAFPASSF